MRAESGTVVDLACGSAPLHPLVSGHLAYLGMDISTEELKLARERDRTPVIRADATRLPLADASVDVVACSMAIMLLVPVERALREMHRVLRPGGVVATIRPVGWPIAPRDVVTGAALFAGLRGTPEMPRRFRPSQLTRLMTAAGFDVTDDSARRFSHPLETPDHAQLVVSALYLPHFAERRQERARRILEKLASHGRDFPVSIRRTLAVKSRQ